jgi:hypothetical protein
LSASVITAEDLADRPDPIPWYYPLEGDLRKCQTVYDYLTVFRTSKLGQMITHNGVWALEKVGLVPKGTFEVGETLRLAGAALVEGGQQKVRLLRSRPAALEGFTLILSLLPQLFTPMMTYVVRKPL